MIVLNIEGNNLSLSKKNIIFKVLNISGRERKNIKKGGDIRNMDPGGIKEVNF